MYKNNSILAIIPARGGSKGLPQKNIRLLSGKPLISWTIEQALESEYIDYIVVSSDDDKILEISSVYDIYSVKRPSYLSRDSSSIISVVKHTISYLRKISIVPDIIMVLQPTSPLRRIKDIMDIIQQYFEGYYDSAVSVNEAKVYWGFSIIKGLLSPIMGLDSLKMRRQNLPKTYIPNGAIYIARKEIIEKVKSFYTERTMPYIMPKNCSIDIDDENDFLLAEILINSFSTNNENNKNNSKTRH